MKSVSRFVDGNAIAAEVRMQRQTHKGTILLVEGATDIKRFARFVDDIECLSIDSHGRPNLIFAIKLLSQMRVKGILAIADADFDRISGACEDTDNLFYSDSHDLDLDLIFSDSLLNFLRETADPVKIEAVGGISEIRRIVIECLAPLSLLRFVNQRDKLRYNLKEIDHSRFFDGTNIDEYKMIEEASRDLFSAPADKKTLSEKIENCRPLKLDGMQMTNGHDACAVIEIMLMDRLSKRHHVLCRLREIESGLRMSVDQTAFKSLPISGKIRKWEERNRPFLVLRYDAR